MRAKGTLAGAIMLLNSFLKEFGWGTWRRPRVPKKCLLPTVCLMSRQQCGGSLWGRQGSRRGCTMCIREDVLGLRSLAASASGRLEASLSTNGSSGLQQFAFLGKPMRGGSEQASQGLALLPFENAAFFQVSVYASKKC